MSADSGIRLSTLKVDGGAAANNYLLQTQADISNAPVERPSSVETTALGAAYLAGLAVGFWSGPEELAKKHAIDKMFVPDISEEERRKRLRGWRKAVRCAPTTGRGTTTRTNNAHPMAAPLPGAAIFLLKKQPYNVIIK